MTVNPGKAPANARASSAIGPISRSHFDVPHRPRTLFPQDKVGLPLLFPDHEDPPVAGKGLGFDDLGVSDGKARHPRPFEDPLESRADPDRLRGDGCGAGCEDQDQGEGDEGTPGARKKASHSRISFAARIGETFTPPFHTSTAWSVIGVRRRSLSGRPRCRRDCEGTSALFPRPVRSGSLPPGVTIKVTVAVSSLSAGCARRL